MLAATVAETLFRCSDNMLEVFQKMDKDGSCAIGGEELRKALRRVGVNLTPAEVAAMLDVFDVDRNGIVTYTDFYQTVDTYRFHTCDGVTSREVDDKKIKYVEGRIRDALIDSFGSLEVRLLVLLPLIVVVDSAF